MVSREIDKNTETLLSTPLIPIYSNDMHDAQASFGQGQGSNNDDPVDVKWQETLDKVAAAVVSVKFCHTRSFDAEKAVSSEATGFVVDTEKGYALFSQELEFELMYLQLYSHKSACGGAEPILGKVHIREP